MRCRCVMRRQDIGELHEQPWFPASLRDAVTDILQFLLNCTHYQKVVAPLLRAVLNRSGATQVVDLCSGAGGPWLELLEILGQDSRISVYLTDKFPNEKRLKSVQKESRGRITYASDPVDAEAVPHSLRGFRTLFNSIHHFSPKRVQAIFQNAVERQEGIAVFEVPRRTIATLCMTIFMGLGTWFAVPFVRPFQASLFLWTYLVPVLPAVMWLDGIASCLRAYTPPELQQLCAFGESQNYCWKAGISRIPGSPIKITYLLGYPMEQRTKHSMNRVSICKPPIASAQVGIS
jgi:hypothetical protein